MTNVITNITPFEEDPNYRVIFVNGSPEVTIPTSAVERLELDIQQPWTDELATQVTSMTDLKRATGIALQLVSRKAWGVQELAQRLVKRGVDPSIAKQTVEQLDEDGWLDDFNYACARIREWTRNEPASRYWLQRKLQERKLSQDISKKAIDEEFGDMSEQDAATHVARVRLAKIGDLDETTIRRRVISALGRRGFSSDVGAEALRRAQADLA